MKKKSSLAKRAVVLAAMLSTTVAIFRPAGVLAAEPAGANLLVNGAFAEGLAGWDLKGAAAVQDQDGVKTLVVTSGGVVQQVALDPAWRRLRLSLRLRAVGVEVGDQDWKTARLAMSFYKADGKRTKGWPDVFMCSGTTGWALCQRDYAIPADATRLEISPANFGASGQALFQNIRLVALASEEAGLTPAQSGVVSLATPETLVVKPLPPKDKFHLFVLMGQSNMHGLANPPAEYRKPNPRVLSLQPDGQWVQAKTPLDPWRVGGFSLGESFARHYAELHPEVTVGVIMAAQAADSLEELSKGAVDKHGRAVYDDAMHMILPALSQGTIKAVLWHQGEANVADKEYPAKLKQFVETLRADLKSPDLPFIAGELGRFATWTAAFNEALPSVMQAIPNTALASSKGLADRGDKVHFSGASAETLGRRYLSAYLSLVEPGLVSKVDVAVSTTSVPKGVPMKRANPQIILLKLDDVSYWISPRWRRTADFLEQKNIKAAFGVIGQGLEKAGPETVQWILELRRKGLVEFWLHGYKLRTATDTGEFEQGTAEEQRATLEKCQSLAKEKLGFEFSAFGPHWTGTTGETEQALQAVSSIKIWLNGPRDSQFFKRLSIPRVMGLENPTFLPDFEKFKSAYETAGFKADVLVLQGHPEAWGEPSRWEGFVKIVEYLQSQGCVFMTPSEYLASLGGINP